MYHVIKTQECLASGDLETATSCLIILQNLEPSDVSRLVSHSLLMIAFINWLLKQSLNLIPIYICTRIYQHATLLLDTALAKHKWEVNLVPWHTHFVTLL